ncbi:MAG: lysylphosphatidylglycerol synthase transmembrane domain-containing protein [Planctomycetota bacterium]
MKRIWRKSFKIVVSAGLLTYLFLTIDVSELGPLFARIHLGWFAAALAVFLAARLVVALRWAVMLSARGVRLSLLRALQLSFIGAFFNTFLPSSMGGDAIRALHVARAEAGLADSFVSVVLERVVGLVALVLLTSVGCLLVLDEIRGTGALLAVAVLWAGLALAGLVFYTWGTWSGWIRRLGEGRPRLAAALGKLGSLHESVLGFRRAHRVLAAGLGLSLVYRGISVLGSLALAWSLGIHIRAVYFVVFHPIRQCIMMVPVTIFGAGLREASAVFFYTQVGMSRAEALGFGLAGGAAMLLINAVGGLVYAFSGAKRPPGADAGEGPPAGPENSART